MHHNVQSIPTEFDPATKFEFFNRESEAIGLQLIVRFITHINHGSRNFPPDESITLEAALKIKSRRDLCAELRSVLTEKIDVVRTHQFFQASPGLHDRLAFELERSGIKDEKKFPGSSGLLADGFFGPLVVARVHEEIAFETGFWYRFFSSTTPDQITMNFSEFLQSISQWEVVRVVFLELCTEYRLIIGSVMRAVCSSAPPRSFGEMKELVVKLFDEPTVLSNPSQFADNPKMVKDVLLPLFIAGDHETLDNQDALQNLLEVTCEFCLERINGAEKIPTLVCDHHMHEKCLRIWNRRHGGGACPACTA